MRKGLLLGIVLVTAGWLVGCTSSDENPDWNPQEEYPDWAYNKPMYFQPVVELRPQEKVGNNIPVYYCREDMFFIRHPAGRQKDVRPHVAVWYSHDDGQCWRKGGYFGMDQTHFLFKAEQDGRYWIRFVGPGQDIAEVPPGQPHRIYVVDTESPQIHLEIVPSPWEDKKKTIPRLYRVGERVTLLWTINDMNLLKNTVRLSTCFARFPHNLVWSRFRDDIQPAGSIEVVLPTESAHQAGMRFRIIAHDKAGNIGIGMSEIMQVLPGSAVAGSSTAAPAPPPRADKARRQPPKVSQPPTEPRARQRITTPAAQPSRPVVSPRPAPESPDDWTPAADWTLPATAPADTTDRKTAASAASPQAGEKVVPRTAEMMPALPAPTPPAKPTVAKQTPPKPKPAPKLEKTKAKPAAVKIKPKPVAKKTSPTVIKPKPTAKKPATTVKPKLTVKKTVPEKPKPTVVKKPDVVEIKPIPAVKKPASTVVEPKPIEEKPDAKKAKPKTATIKKPAPMVIKPKPTEKKPAAKKVKPKPVVKKPAPAAVKLKPAKKKPLVAKPKPTVKKPAPAVAKPKPAVKKPATVKIKPKPDKSPATEPKPRLQKISAKPAGKTQPVAIVQPKKSSPPALVKIKLDKAKPEKKPASRVSLQDIPERVQQGWPAKGMVLRGGVSRLLNWMPDKIKRYKKAELQFSSDDGKKWLTIARGLKQGRVVMWTVPVITSKKCRLRIVGLPTLGKQTVLVTSDIFTVDTGAWETIDISGFKTEVPKKTPSEK